MPAAWTALSGAPTLLGTPGHNSQTRTNAAEPRSQEGSMRKLALTSAATAMALALAGVVAVSPTSQAAEPAPTSPRRSPSTSSSAPFSPIAANNVRDRTRLRPGRRAGLSRNCSPGQAGDDDIGSCMIASITSQELAANCSLVVRLPTATSPASSSPSPPQPPQGDRPDRGDRQLPQRRWGGDPRRVRQRQRAHDPASPEPGRPRRPSLIGRPAQLRAPAARTIVARSSEQPV